MKKGTIISTPEQRFLMRVKFSPDCWEWRGGGNGNGYGRMYLSPGKKVYPHRLSYELFVGTVPDGMVVDHLCDNRKCVNPKHLKAVTQRENILRGCGTSAKNAIKTHCHRGHKFTKENTYLRKRGSRDCRTCRKINDKK